MKQLKSFRIPMAATAAAALVAVAGCNNDRTAEADTPVSEAEVSTELPESVVSDEQLEATANIAANIAATPPPEVVPVPVTTGNGAATTTTNTTAQ